MADRRAEALCVTAEAMEAPVSGAAARLLSELQGAIARTRRAAAELSTAARVLEAAELELRELVSRAEAEPQDGLWGALSPAVAVTLEHTPNTPPTPPKASVPTHQKALRVLAQNGFFKR